MTKTLDVTQYQKKTCRYCNADLVEPFLELGTLPLANSFIPIDKAGEFEFKCPLSLCYCPKCSLVQLSHVTPAELMFSNYLYVSSTTRTFQEHFAKYAKTLKDRLTNPQNALAVDIGSNDGLLLECYKREGLRICGVEPAKNLSDLSNQKGIPTINRYFDSETVSEIIQKHGKASVVSANNVFAHIDDVRSVCKNVYSLLDDNGIFVLEFPYLLTMLDELLFDMIYHEHLSYISVYAVTYLFEQFGLQIFDIDYVPSHGGSLRVFVKKKIGPYAINARVGEYLKREKEANCLSLETYKQFARRVHAIKDKFVSEIKRIRSAGQTISGYGAPAKASTLIGFCDLTASDIDYIVDDNPLKQNHLSPGARIPVVASSHLEKHPTNYIIIFAWNFAAEIMEKLKPHKDRGVKFMIPLPEPKVI